MKLIAQTLKGENQVLELPPDFYGLIIENEDGDDLRILEASDQAFEIRTSEGILIVFPESTNAISVVVASGPHPRAAHSET